MSMLRTFISALLALMVLLFMGLPHGSAEWSISTVSERYAPAVVKITTMDEAGRTIGSGSGFFVNSRGAVATNFHVLENASTALVRTAGGGKGEVVGITHADPGVDLLIAGTSFRNTPAVALGDSDTVVAGQSVFVLGNSPGWEGTVSSGMVTHIRKAGDLTLLQLSAPILPGGSGGPVFGPRGDVLGIATAFLDSAYFALPVNYLRTLKAEPSSLKALRGSSVNVEASVAGGTLLELLIRRNLGGPDSKSPTPSSADGRRPLTVYFKNGKKVLCDWAWKEGETLFLVVHGKRFAVGYDLHLIDAKRSLL